MPGVQKPHCSAWWRRNASCSTERRPGSGARPSTVRIVAPSACTASVRQARAGAPSISMVQAPHTPCSQPTWVPVAPSSWRRKSVSSMRGSASPSTARPLSVRRTRWRCSALRRGMLRASSMVLAAELAHQIAALVRGGVQVVARLELDGEVLQRVVERGAVERAEVLRGGPVGDAADREPRALRGGDRRAGDDGEIAVPARELAERVAVARLGAGEAHRLDQFVVLARGGHQAGEEIVRPRRGVSPLRTTIRSRRRARSAPAEFPRSDRRARPSRRPCRVRASARARPRAAPARAAAGASPAPARPAATPAARPRRRGSHCPSPRCRRAPRRA